MIEPQDRIERPAQDDKPVRLSRILVATDFSQPSDVALFYAAAVARRFDAYVFLMHVLTAVDDLGHPERSSSLYQEQRQVAERAIEKILASKRLQSLPHEVLLEEGYLWPTIEQFVQGSEVDLIAVGTHGTPTAQHQPVGSAAELIFRNVDCPVLTVGPACRCDFGPGPEEEELADRPVFGRILFATDFGRAAEHATKYAVAFVQAFQTRMTMLHVIGAVPSNDADREILRETARIRLVEAAPEEIAPRLKIETRVEFGDAPEQILRVARAMPADLIIMGARAGRTLLTHHLPETSAYTVASAAPCPLLTIRR